MGATEDVELRDMGVEVRGGARIRGGRLTASTTCERCATALPSSRSA